MVSFQRGTASRSSTSGDKEMHVGEATKTKDSLGGRACSSPQTTIQILVGLFNIGLGPGRTSTHPGDLSSLGAAYWLGAVFIVSGIVSILAGQLRSSCLMGFSVFMNIAGGIFAITAIVLYGMDLRDTSLLWICDRSSDDAVLDEDNCRNVALFAQKLLKSLDITLIILALLQLAVNIRYAIWGIRALCPQGDKDVEEQLPQISQPILKEVLMMSPGAEKGFTLMFGSLK
ncbi:uncharacterized protein LOC113032846 [Astatotilapia calliptera]|uniref:uncharacterized protein LOC113032846 n=1 Tax=Astatotilapia calliptera TaxID=8154 RepID=UPI000E4182E8|nr:uncharacterized protein LOC113032846 [Astatotilapia calliptera]